MSEATPSKRSRRRILLAVLACLLLLAVGVLRHALFDEALLPDDDLARPLGAALPTASENGIDLLLRADAAVVDPGDLLRLYMEPEPKEAVELLEQNRSALELFHQAMARPYLVAGDGTEEEVMAAVQALRRLATLSLLAANDSERRGDSKATLSIAYELLSGGAAFDRGVDGVVAWLTAQDLRREGSRLLYPFVAGDRLTRAELRDLGARLVAAEPRTDDLRRIILRSYSQIRTEITEGTILEAFSVAKRHEERLRFFPRWYVYKPQRTRNELADGIRLILSTLENRPGDVHQRIKGKMRRQDSIWQWVTHGNPLGVEIVGGTCATEASLVRRLAEVRVDLRGVRLVAALKEYESAHGQLPDSLDALVPDFLKAVPVDPMNGESFGYSREKGVVWSIGSTLRNPNGTKSPLVGDGDHWDALFPTFHITLESEEKGALQAKPIRE